MGKSKTGSICKGTAHSAGIVRWADDTDELIQSIAHEIGHAIGMHHDFDSYIDDPHLDRRGTCGPSKWETGEGNYIMNYAHPMETAWSECSNMDFVSYYQSQLVKDGAFCLAERENSASGIKQDDTFLGLQRL